MWISCVRGTRQTHLGVNPYGTDGTDLEIVTWKQRIDVNRQSWETVREKKHLRRIFWRKKKKNPDTWVVLINIPDFTPCYQSGESAPSIPQMGSGMRETAEPEQQQPPAFLQFNRDGRSADVWWEPASRKRPVLNLVDLRWTDNQEKPQISVSIKGMFDISFLL